VEQWWDFKRFECRRADLFAASVCRNFLRSGDLEREMLVG
jgi:hypothetical protein